MVFCNYFHINKYFTAFKTDTHSMNAFTFNYK